ncbi:hypothetical protein [Thermus sp. FJN-A]
MLVVAALALAQGSAPGVLAQVYFRGQLVAQGSLDQVWAGQVQGAGEVRLALEGQVYAFALAEAGRTLGETRVWLNGEKERLARVAAELQAALKGEKDVALFLRGDRVVGLVEVNPRARVSAEGATRVVLLVNGEERTLEVRHAGSVLAEVTVQVGGEARGLLEVAWGRGTEGTAPGNASGRSGGEGGVGVGLGIGIGIGAGGR